MSKQDPRDLANLPNTLEWLKNHIKGFREYYEAVQRAQADTEERRKQLLPPKAANKP